MELKWVDRVVVAEAINDFVEKIGEIPRFNWLLRREIIIQGERLPGSTTR